MQMAVLEPKLVSHFGAMLEKGSLDLIVPRLRQDEA